MTAQRDGEDNRRQWAALLTDLERRRTAARAMGGPERLARHRARGRGDARARVTGLLDPGSLTELGTLAGDEDHPADGLIAGAGRIDGRPVLIGAEDFTVASGSIRSEEHTAELHSRFKV